MNLLDQHLLSWLGWEYKTYIRKTGFNDAIFDEDLGDKRPDVLRMYSRPFAHAVPGVIDHMNYDDETRNFTLIWTVPPYYSSKKGAIISTGKDWHYPLGMKINLHPNISYFYTEDGRFIHFSVLQRQYPQTMRLEILPSDSYD
jgi:hypothetical protein